MEIANINKTISGTRLGALSALQIMEEMENENQLQGSTFNGFDNLVKRMDSEIIEDPVQFHIFRITKVRESRSPSVRHQQ